MRRAGLPALAGYAVPAGLLAVPLPLLLSSSRLLGDGDAWLFVWNMWWLDFALDHGLPLMCSPWIYHPQGACLYLHTLVLPLSLFSVLLQGLLGRPQIYNLLAWASFVLAGWGMYRLGIRLGLSKGAAWLAGLAFSFSPYHFAHALGHLNLMSYQWLPFYLISGLNLAQKGWSIPRVAAAAAWLTLIALTDWYYFLFACLASAFLPFWGTSSQALHRRVLRSLSPILLSVIVLSPLLWHMIELSRTIPPQRTSGVASADILSFFLPGPVSSYAPLLSGWLPNWRALAAEGGTFVPWSVIGLAVWGWLGLDSKRNRLALIWIGFFGLLSLGPHLQAGGRVFEWMVLPYGWLAELPGLHVMRAPIRFHLMTSLALCLLYACGVERLMQRHPSTRNRWILALGLLVLAESLSWPPQTSSSEVSPFYHRLAREGGAGAVIDLHIGAQALYRQTVHEHPLFGREDMLSRTSARTIGKSRYEPLRQLAAENHIVASSLGFSAPVPPNADRAVVLGSLSGEGRIEVATSLPHALWLELEQLNDGRSATTPLSLNGAGPHRIRIEMVVGQEERNAEIAADVTSAPGTKIQLAPTIDIKEYARRGFTWLFYRDESPRMNAPESLARLRKEGFTWIVVPFYGNSHYVREHLGLRPDYVDAKLTAYRIQGVSGSPQQ